MSQLLKIPAPPGPRPPSFCFKKGSPFKKPFLAQREMDSAPLLRDEETSSTDCFSDEGELVPDTPGYYGPLKRQRRQREQHADEMDGWATSLFIDTVKTAVYHLVNLVINKYRTDECNGCKIDHPSQRQHECLQILEDDFYSDNYYNIRKKLLTPHFVPSIQRLLIARNIKTEDVKVGMVAETLLHELKSVRKVFDAITDAYDNLVGQDVVKIGELRLVTEFYKGC